MKTAKIEWLGNYQPTKNESNPCAGRVYGPYGLSPALRTKTGGGGEPSIMEKKNMSEEDAEYRIRRLSAKECWRLMGYSDKDYEAAAKAVSQSQLYKQAGNAIVENVLVAIFGQMILGKENIYKERGNRKCE